MIISIQNMQDPGLWDASLAKKATFFFFFYNSESKLRIPACFSQNQFYKSSESEQKGEAADD